MHAIETALLSFDGVDGQGKAIDPTMITQLTVGPSGGTRLWFPDGAYIDVCTPGDKVRKAWEHAMDRSRRPQYRARIL